MKLIAESRRFARSLHRKALTHGRRLHRGTRSCGANFTACLSLLLLLVGMTGCEPLNQSADVGVGAAATPAPYTSTRLGEGDLIKVGFEGDSSMNTAVQIQLNGTVSLPLVGNVKAVGMTPEELRTDLMERYKNLLSINEITVSLMKPRAIVYVSGAVLKPGTVPMDRPLTALEAIMECGGFDHRRARPSNVSVIRKEEGQQKTFKVDLKRALTGEDPNPFYLKPYDVVHVPEKTFNF